MEENKGLLLKCAMSYGLAMGIYWVIKYLFLIFGYSIPSLIFIYEGLSLAVPLIAYYLTKRYRQDIGGSISFFHAWRIEHFIFFQFIAPPDFLNNTMTQAIVALKNADFDSEVIEAISRTNFTPIHMAIQGIFNNIFYGIILSIPVAALVCRKQTASPVSEEK